MVKKYMAPVSISMRWGHKTTPVWVYGSTVSNPPAGTTLVSVTIPDKYVGYIYGFYIVTPEANDFEIKWSSGVSNMVFKVLAGSRGTTYFADIIPINEGLPANRNSSITISNVNAGTGNYMAGLLIGLVEVG